MLYLLNSVPQLSDLGQEFSCGDTAKFLHGLIQQSFDVFIPRGFISFKLIVRVSGASSPFWIENLKNLELEVAIAMGPIYDLALNGASVQFWVVIVDVIFQSLEVLLGLSFEIIVSEHVAHLLEMVWRLQAYEVGLLSSSTRIPPPWLMDVLRLLRPPLFWLRLEKFLGIMNVRSLTPCHKSNFVSKSFVPFFLSTSQSYGHRT
jgi:hypothetical protein